jgi:YbbR domain-containing protein
MSSYRSVPLLVSFSGQPRSGYSVVQATIDPPQITITGSPQRLRGISSIKLQPVSLAKRGPGTFVSHARPLLPKGISSHTKTVNVHTQLAAVQASTSIQVGLIPTNVAPGLVAQIRPARVLATVVGPTNELQGAGANIRALVDLSNYGAGTSVIMPRLSVKGKLRVVGLYPSTVTVTLTPSA